MKVSIEELLAKGVIEPDGDGDFIINGEFLLMVGDVIDESFLTYIVRDDEINQYVGFDYLGDHYTLCNVITPTIKCEIYRKVNEEFFCG